MLRLLERRRNAIAPIVARRVPRGELEVAGERREWIAELVSMSALRSRSSSSLRCNVSSVLPSAARAPAPSTATIRPSKKKPTTSTPFASQGITKPAGGVKYAAMIVAPTVASSAGPNPPNTALAATGTVRKRSGPWAPKAGTANLSAATKTVKTTATP